MAISKARSHDKLQSEAAPETIVHAAQATGSRAIAYTYNDPVIFLEYAVDVAKAAREQGIKNVAVTAGYISEKAREEFFSVMDAANIDLKAFTDGFYRSLCSAELKPILETLEYVKRETDVWLEITTLLIPGHNDSPSEIAALSEWIVSQSPRPRRAAPFLCISSRLEDGRCAWNAGRHARSCAKNCEERRVTPRFHGQCS